MVVETFCTVLWSWNMTLVIYRSPEYFLPFTVNLIYASLKIIRTLRGYEEGMMTVTE